MAFADTETSPYSAAPIELFKFIGTVATYRMTTYSQTVVSGTDTYTPLAGLKRTVLKVGTQEEENLALDIELPYDHPLVTAYAYQTAPPTLELELRRTHRDNPADSILMWKGKVLSFSVAGRIAKLRVPSLFAYILGGVTPAPRYQAPCNHILYDGRCSVDPTTFLHATTVTSITDNLITLASNPFSDGLCNGGDMTFAAGGEARMVISNAVLDFTVTYPFSGLSIGSAVTIRQGCDHSYTTCKSKFSNGINFGGCPLVPDRNPFTSKI